MYILLYLYLFITLFPLLFLSLWLPIYVSFFSLSDFNFIIIRWNLKYSLEVLLTRFKLFFSRITFTIPSQLFFVFFLSVWRMMILHQFLEKFWSQLLRLLLWLISSQHDVVYIYFSYFLCLIFLLLPSQFTFYAFIHLFYQ